MDLRKRLLELLHEDCEKLQDDFQEVLENLSDDLWHNLDSIEKRKSRLTIFVRNLDELELSEVALSIYSEEEIKGE